MFLANCLLVFKISSRFFKVHIFGSIFSLKLSLRYKTMLNSIKTLKRYSKAILNVFFNKTKFDDDKELYLYGTFFVSNRNFTTKM